MGQGVGREGGQVAPPCSWCEPHCAHKGAGRLHWRAGGRSFQGQPLPLLSGLCQSERQESMSTLAAIRPCFGAEVLTSKCARELLMSLDVNFVFAPHFLRLEAAP